jgi:magnesium-transporting ATPase (P-type)
LTRGAFFLGTYVLPAPEGFTPAPGSNAFYDIGISMAFVVLSWASVINIFNVRSDRSIFKVNMMSNKGLFFAAIGTILFTLFVALVPPVAEVFDVRIGLSGMHWLVMVGLALMQLVIGEIHKLFFVKNK